MGFHEKRQLPHNPGNCLFSLNDGVARKLRVIILVDLIIRIIIRLVSGIPRRKNSPLVVGVVFAPLNDG